MLGELPLEMQNKVSGHLTYRQLLKYQTVNRTFMECFLRRHNSLIHSKVPVGYSIGQFQIRGISRRRDGWYIEFLDTNAHRVFKKKAKVVISSGRVYVQSLFNHSKYYFD